MRIRSGFFLTHSNTWYISIVIHQIPLVADEVESQHMVVHLIGKVVETTKDIDLITATIRYGSIHQTGRLLAESADNPWPITVGHGTVLCGRVRQDVGVVGRSACGGHSKGSVYIAQGQGR